MAVYHHQTRMGKLPGARALKAHCLQLLTFSMILSQHAFALSTGDRSHHCRRLIQLGGGKKPGFVAVIAHRDEDLTWASQLPLPSLVYDIDSNSSITYAPLDTAVAAYIQYIIDHYDCLPSWTLFLSSHGRNSFSGSGMDHGGGGLVSKGLKGYGGAFAAAAADTNKETFHPLPPGISSALLDVGLIDRGFLAVNHLSTSQLSRQMSHPATLGFSSHAPEDSHRMAFVSEEEKRRGCSCTALHALLPDDAVISCERPWAWPLGGEFWASSKRITNRPIEFWQDTLTILAHGYGNENQQLNHKRKSGKNGKLRGRLDFNDDMTAVFPSLGKHNSALDADSVDIDSELHVSGSQVRAHCFETILHRVLGEPMYHYTPIYEYFEAMPVVSFQERCVEGRKRLSRSCRFLKVPQLPRTIQPKIHSEAEQQDSTSQSDPHTSCVALHGDMLGVDLMVTTYAGGTLSEADHSCCKKCRSLPQCTFWVRATNTRECWLKTSFIGYGSQSNRRGMFISEFNGIFLNEL